MSFKIFADEKAKELAKISIAENTFYYFGGGSSPNRVFVTKINNDTVTYKNFPFYYSKEYFCMLGLFKAQVLDATKQKIKSEESYLRHGGKFGNIDYHERLITELKAFLDGKPLPVENLEDFRKFEVKVRQTIDSEIEKKDFWYYCETFGGGCSEGPGYIIINGVYQKTVEEMKNSRHLEILDIWEDKFYLKNRNL
jgi:hypothetical protein